MYDFIIKNHLIESSNTAFGETPSDNKTNQRCFVGLWLNFAIYEKKAGSFLVQQIVQTYPHTNPHVYTFVLPFSFSLLLWLLFPQWNSNFNDESMKSRKIEHVAFSIKCRSIFPSHLFRVYLPKSCKRRVMNDIEKK